MMTSLQTKNKDLLKMNIVSSFRPSNSTRETYHLLCCKRCYIHQSHNAKYWWFAYDIKNMFTLNYNIPRACLLSGSPVPAMDLKSNRSGLWRHMLETCHRLRRLCRKHSNNVARHDETPVKLTLLSRDVSFMSHSSDIMLWLLYV